MTKELLCDIITHTEKAGFPVHAIICDLSGGNQGLLKSLGVNVNNPNFDHPHQTDRKVHVFADTPLMLKLIRNNILDHGLETPLGIVNSEPLHEIVHYQKGDFKLTPKVSEANLQVKGPQRQKVKVAAHLLSGTMAKSLEYLGSQGILKSKSWKLTPTD